MNSELIAGAILFVSLAGIGVIILRKIPLLLELPETVPSHFSWREFFKKIRSAIPLKVIPSEIFLQKILSKFRVLTLKTDSKTSSWLQKLRERAKKKKFSEEDNYWKEIKKSTKK